MAGSGPDHPCGAHVQPRAVVVVLRVRLLLERARHEGGPETGECRVRGGQIMSGLPESWEGGEVNPLLPAADRLLRWPGKPGAGSSAPHAGSVSVGVRPTRSSVGSLGKGEPSRSFQDSLGWGDLRRGSGASQPQFDGSVAECKDAKRNDGCGDKTVGHRAGSNPAAASSLWVHGETLGDRQCALNRGPSGQLSVHPFPFDV